MNTSYNEFHISRAVRDKCQFNQGLFASSGNVIFANLKAVQEFQLKLNALFDERDEKEKKVSAGNLNAMGLIDEIFHFVCTLFRRNKAPLAFTNLLADLDSSFGKDEIDTLLMQFMDEFPPTAVYQKKLTSSDYLFQTCLDPATGKQRDNREQVLEEMILLHLANENPAFHPFGILFDDQKLSLNANYIKTWNQIKAYFKTQPVFGSKNNDLITMLKEPIVASPTSLKGQLDYIRKYWSDLLGEWLKRLLEGIDTISEEEKAAWHPTNGGSPDMAPYSYENLMKEYERFSPDRDWMPKVVLMAKTVLVWLYQLSKKYNRSITRLDQIPDEELDALRDEGFTGLWLIGLWQRSDASKRIKQLCGNPEAAASAYSLNDYEIADNIGGWDALANLRTRLWKRGIRLASDMVPNHTGMDSKWVAEKPDLFVQRRDNPFPQYTFNGENLSHDPRVAIYLEDHYYSKNDCAVVFKRVDTATGDTRYIYHGNDGTGMPWNDTAQIDFLNPEAREEVMQEILHVARNFPIIRFDAAMVLAKKHIRRLWYPEPGKGGDIASRSRFAIARAEFEQRIPEEFWREVVDRCAKEIPDTLLLAEAFWMMEGYFTRTLGMHWVYNSAFMNMLKREENAKYRTTIKNTIQFDPQVLKRFVNFMNNPDEETAVAQFGKGDKYFGVCTLMITMPGLPMFGHGQIEGFEEKYGMEYTKAYRNEKPDQGLIARHWHDIFPLMKKRYLFAQVEDFLFYDVWDNGQINENVYAYSNGAGDERTLVFYNNKYDRASGWIKQSCEYAVKTGSGVQASSRTISEGLRLTADENAYCILREQRSGLWFVRNSKDICENGMFTSLNGFEAQVYIDIHQIADLPDHRYRTLCETLAGRGCEDLEIEWEEIRYRELYRSLASFVIPIIPEIASILHPADAKDTTQENITAAVKHLLAEAEPSAEAFFKTAVSFASDENITLPPPKDQFRSFSEKFLRIALLNAGGTAAKTVKDSVTVLKKSSDGNAFIRTMMNSNTDTAFLFACYTVVSSLADRGCASAWSLARKFSEYAKSTGTAEVTIRNQLERIFILASESDLSSLGKDITKHALKISSYLVLENNSALLSGTNLFNGVQWFNKELSDSIR